jgi:tRNA threonylcarbamoyladenosine biosynthesis protein TsaB
MLFAAIESSGDGCSVALWNDGAISALEQRAPNRHSELVLPMLHELFGKTSTEVARLEAVAFGAGPGSFTGLRVACGVAQGLAFARSLPVLGVSSFEAIAQESGAERVVACIDARMREVYYAALERRGGTWHEVIEAQCVAPEAATPPPAGNWLGCGSGFAAYPGFLKDHLSSVKPEINPGAVAIAALAAPRLAAGKGVDAALALPTYLRNKVAHTAQELARR